MKVKNFLKSFFSMFLILTILVASGLPVSASVKFPVGRETEWSENNILFYNPGQSDCVHLGEGGGGGDTGWDGYCDVLSSAQKAWVDKWYSLAHRLGEQYNIPWEAAMAQSINESRSGTSNFAVNRHNFFGLGAPDQHPEYAFAWENDEKGWEGYFKYMAGESAGNIRVSGHPPVGTHGFNEPPNQSKRYVNAGATSPPASTNPYTYISVIAKAGYNPHAEYINEISQLICGVESYAMEQGYDLTNGTPGQGGSSSGTEEVGLNSTSFATLAVESSTPTNNNIDIRDEGESEALYDTDGSNVTIIGDSINVVVSGTHTVEGGAGKNFDNRVNYYALNGLSNATVYARWGRDFARSKDALEDDSNKSQNVGGLVLLEELANSGRLKKIVVYALGTNNSGYDGSGPVVSQAEIDKVLSLVGDRAVIFVANVAKTASGDAVPFPSNNALFTSTAGSHSNVYVAAWDEIVSANPNIMLEDTFHPTTTGADAYAKMIKTLVGMIDLNSISGSGGGSTNSNGGGVFNPCPPESGGEAGEIQDGGFKTIEEAVAFMQVYIDAARKKEHDNPVYVAGTAVNAPVNSKPPEDGTLNNCSAFTQWFVRHYTGKPVPLVNGYAAVSVYSSSFGLEYGGHIPQPYAVMSTNQPNHTGIVLGIDKETDTLLLGEASYHNGFVEGNWPYVHRKSLQLYTSSYYTYAYTGATTGSM